ncbi:MAG: transposase [Acidobacteriia bacterium]|nr:transposase [Terriglobia bacterium]
MTVCARERKCLFGGIESDQMRNSPIGQMVASCWLEIPKHFPNAALDEFVIMPNHLHGIVLLDVVAGHARPLPVIIGSFKSAVSRQAGFCVWQRSYWERIIRNGAELNQTRQYIAHHPATWSTDKENPTHLT